jgi:hypothetical protein
VSEQLTEQEEIVTWRYLALLGVGYPHEPAQAIAERWSGANIIDLHDACALVQRGCAPEVAAAILL